MNKTTKITLTNSFSINMIEMSMELTFQKIDRWDARALSKEVSENAIGHKDTDNVVRSELDLSIEGERKTLSFKPEDGDVLLVAQYKGPRLEEGTKTLPEGATIEYWLVASPKTSVWIDRTGGEAPFGCSDRVKDGIVTRLVIEQDYNTPDYM